jgi:hypothetical protein
MSNYLTAKAPRAQRFCKPVIHENQAPRRILYPVTILTAMPQRACENLMPVKSTKITYQMLFVPSEIALRI